MRKLLAAMFVALLMAGCGESTKKPAGDSPESNQSSAPPPESNESSAETPPAKTAEVGGIDLDDKKTLDRIIAEAIDLGKLEWKSKEGAKLPYAPNQETPYTGWVKEMYDDGQIEELIQFKDGKLWTAVKWKPNGEKCPETNVVDGNGVEVYYNDDGTEAFRQTFKDGELVRD